jgi:hypothetical protein
MRSKVRTRAVPPPPSPGTSRASGIIIGVVLLAIGVALGLSAGEIVKLVPASTGSASGSPSASASESGLALESPSESGPAASESPSASPSPPAPVLEGEMPRSVNGTTLTVQSATDATSLGRGPMFRALNAGVTKLGKKPSDLEIAEAYDESGSLALSVLGFRVSGVDAAKLRDVVFEAWLSTKTPGVTTADVTLSGTPATKVSYADSGPAEYAFIRGDSVFVVETEDQALASAVVTAMENPSASASASPSGSPSVASSPSPSGS